MSKKHFEALAAALRESMPSNDAMVFTTREHYVRLAQWKRGVDTVMTVCARFNPNFDRERFLTACGVEG